MESVKSTFSINPNAFHAFVTQAQEHLKALSEKAKEVNRLGSLTLEYSIVRTDPASGIEYEVEYEGKTEIRTPSPFQGEVGFRQTWKLGPGESVERYDFYDEGRKISRLIEGALSYKVSCSIIGFTESGKIISVVK